MQESNSVACEQVTRWNRHHEYLAHSHCCRKCVLKQNAKSLCISVHEWPLPQLDLEAKSAVFELDVPIEIGKWRDITYTLLVDIFSPQSHSDFLNKSNVYTLQNFSGLSGFVQCKMGRLQLASKAKPFVVAHYGVKKVPAATEANICANNGLRYSIYDSKLQKWTTELLDRCDVRKICTFQLPSGSYKTLQYPLDRNTHTSNEILAGQAECPRGLNLHEFYAFATLRSGHRLQWRNIARELIAHVLNFSHEETYMLVVQAAWQAGYSRVESICRESHVDLEEEEFGISLVSALVSALATVEDNWQGAGAVRIFVALATRLLSVSPHSTVHRGCYLHLRRARHVALQWTRDVVHLLHERHDAEELKDLNLKVLEMALTCHGTFDIDQDHLPAMLSSSEDVAVITECCIVIHDHCPAVTQTLPGPLKTLLRRYEKLSYSLESHLRGQILRDPSSINSTVRRIWAGYRPGSPWTAISKPDGRWLTTETSTEGGYSSMTVHFNILDGSLLVNGSPLTRLPRSYELHATYQRLPY